MIHPLIKKILRGYLIVHFALLLTVAWGPAIYIFGPIDFVLYGGIQALLLWRFINRKTEISVFWRWSIYFFSLMQLMYTAALFLFGASFRYGLSLDCLRSFNALEFGDFIYAKYPNLVYFTFALIWGFVALIWAAAASGKKEGRT